MDLGLKFDRIITSPLKRSYDTAVIVSDAYKDGEKPEVWEELKPEGNKLDLLRKMSKFKPNSDILLVGHEPYLSTLIGEVVSNCMGTRILLKKGGLAKVQIKTFVPKASGELRWLLTPRLLKRMS